MNFARQFNHHHNRLSFNLPASLQKQTTQSIGFDTSPVCVGKNKGTFGISIPAVITGATFDQNDSYAIVRDIVFQRVIHNYSVAPPAPNVNNTPINPTYINIGKSNNIKTIQPVQNTSHINTGSKQSGFNIKQDNRGAPIKTGKPSNPTTIQTGKTNQSVKVTTNNSKYPIKIKGQSIQPITKKQSSRLPIKIKKKD